MARDEAWSSLPIEQQKRKRLRNGSDVRLAPATCADASPVTPSTTRPSCWMEAGTQRGNETIGKRYGLLYKVMAGRKLRRRTDGSVGIEITPGPLRFDLR